MDIDFILDIWYYEKIDYTIIDTIHHVAPLM